MSLKKSEIERVRAAHDEVMKNLSRRIEVDDLMSLAAMNEHKLQAIFKHLYHETVQSYFVQVKMKMAKDELTETNHSIKGIARKLGYELPGFIKAFKKYYQCTPGDFRKRLPFRMDFGLVKDCYVAKQICSFIWYSFNVAVGLEINIISCEL